MIGVGVSEGVAVARGSARGWLTSRDPGLGAVRSAARVTVVVCVVFYGARYGLGNRVVAIYALFGAVAAGGLCRIPGTPRQRARALVAALPVGWILVTLGTVLAAHTWAAALGMLAVGFLVTFAGVGGPRLVGLATGLQLFYILPCFPPYEPGSLGSRLAGLTCGVMVLAAAELLLWPGTRPGRYEDRLARAADTAGGFLGTLAAGSLPAGAAARLLAASDAIRMSRVPIGERPASASARDRALSQAATWSRYLLAQARRLDLAIHRGRAATDPRAAALLAVVAAASDDVARALDGRSPPPAAGPTADAATAFEHHRTSGFRAGDAESQARLRGGAIALEVTYGANFLVTAVRIALGAPVPPDATPPAERPGPFWYAHHRAGTLYARRLRAHLTPRSVYFQNAVRTAVALAAARIVAGELDLSHGFWALLTTLTVMRSSAADTRTALRPALRGTLAGAAVTALMLYLTGTHTAFYAAVLPPLLLLAFAAGPVLGAGWGQGFFTLAVASAFAQLAATGPELAGIRFLDVLVGGLTGALVGLLTWPRGGAGEMRRAASTLLDQGVAAVADVVDTMTGTRPRGGAALARARLDLAFAEAGYAQYATENREHQASDVDWQAVMVAGHRMVVGAQTLHHRCPPGALAAWPRAAASLRDAAGRLRHTCEALAAQLRSGGNPAPSSDTFPPADEAVIAQLCATAHGDRLDPRLFYAVDAAVWLSSLQAALAAIGSGE